MRVLIAEDDPVSALLLERTLKRGGYDVSVARNGAEALEVLGRERFDALLTDWMMPNIDGIELTRRVRAMVDPQPLIVMVTALASDEARRHALGAGADDYLAKPIDPSHVLALLSNCFERRRQPQPVQPPRTTTEPSGEAPFAGVVLAASTGGPTALTHVVRSLPAGAHAAYFIVLHGPRWVLETFLESLRSETPLPVDFPRDGTRVEPGHIYVAPNDRHLVVTTDPLSLQLSDAPPENFVRPAADPLFRSAAHAFGRRCMAVVLTGMGRDGSLGAAEVAAVGGSVLVQDPADAIASAMPRTVIDLGVAKGVFDLGALPGALEVELSGLAGGSSALPSSEAHTRA